MIRHLALLAALTALGGCASPSPLADSTPTAAATPAASAAQPRVSEQSATAQASAGAPEGPPPGWQAKNRAGQIVYCRKMDVTGSMFPREICLTPRELETAQRAQKTQAQRTLDIPRTTDTQ